jgi:hypothetical protein
MMKITLKEPESGSLLELEVYKMDTPTGIGWCVVLSKKKNVLIKFNNGEWKTEEENNISHEFWQTVGNEITRLLGNERQSQNSIKPRISSDPRPKRPRIFLDF